MDKERFWIQVFKDGQGVNIGSVEGYDDLTACWVATKEACKFWRGHHYEIVSSTGKVVNSGLVG